MKVGHIPYLSCEPFYFDMERRGIALYDVVPSAMAGAVAQGDIDAGPVPLADCFRLTDQCQYLSGFCLATIRKAGSVMLHAKHPIETLTGARIGILARPLPLSDSCRFCLPSSTRYRRRRTRRSMTPVMPSSLWGMRDCADAAASRHTPTSMTWGKNGISGEFALCVCPLDGP